MANSFTTVTTTGYFQRIINSFVGILIGVLLFAGSFFLLYWNEGRFDLSNTPDLLPPIAILALKTSGPIEIFNVRHARFKETDRIAILAQELSKLGVNVTEKEDGLILNAPGIIKSAELNSFEDHRLFMAFSISATFVGNCTVTDPDSVYVSYPTFIDDMNRIGAKILV